MPRQPACRRKEAVERTREAERAALSRAASFSVARPRPSALAMTRRAGRPQAARLDVGIVGAGLAGLQCAYNAVVSGATPRALYEASTASAAASSRCAASFPGQVAERGGELIDNPHKTMLGWVNTLGLTREDLSARPATNFYYFDGQLVPEATVVDEYRAFVAAMRDDLRRLDRGADRRRLQRRRPRARSHELADYLTSRGAGPLRAKAIDEAYVAEYGREMPRAEPLNFLLFIHADALEVHAVRRFLRRALPRRRGQRRDRERHRGAVAQASPSSACASKRVRKTSAGRHRADVPLRQQVESCSTHDSVVLAILHRPARALDASLALPAWKTSRSTSSATATTRR